MIVGELKPLEQIEEMLKGCSKVLVVGCNGCVAVCQTGGPREAESLARLLRLKGIEADWAWVPRQCEWEFLEQLRDRLEGYRTVLSTACGIGVQAVNQYYQEILTLPALNTTFLGMPVEQGFFAERCRACGDCMLHLTGGICPVARCAKNLMNGPCGGSQNGRCEVASEVECAWHLIYERLRKLGRLDDLLAIRPPKDWSSAGHGGPRKMVKEELIFDSEE